VRRRRKDRPPAFDDEVLDHFGTSMAAADAGADSPSSRVK
jgi:hypothetical protein